MRKEVKPVLVLARGALTRLFQKDRLCAHTKEGTGRGISRRVMGYGNPLERDSKWLLGLGSED